MIKVSSRNQMYILQCCIEFATFIYTKDGVLNT